MFQTIGLLLALLWVPITSHCALEGIQGFEFVQCEGSDPVPDQDCAEDVCAELENPKYKVSETDTEVPRPPMAAILADLAIQDALPAKAKSVGVITSPPELASAWLFYDRAAPSPRAPSYV